MVASVVDVLQLPAFLCRQTDMIVAGGEAARKHKRILKIKKGQFVAPHDMGNVVEKAKHFLPLDQILLTERGSCFGYNQLIVDMSGLSVMKSFGTEVIFDATHSVQLPGAQGKSSGGKRSLISPLMRAALASGADGIFMEAHPRPLVAKSDAATAIDFKYVSQLVEEMVMIKNFFQSRDWSQLPD